MAEALAAVSIVASIVQLVDFSTRVLKRLEEYRSTSLEIPEAFRHIKAKLPVLLDALRQINVAIDAGFLSDESKKALCPAVKGCGLEIKALAEVIETLAPKTSDSWATKSKKGLRSIRYDAKIQQRTAVIQEYIQTLTWHVIASSRPSSDSTQPPPPPSSTVPFKRDQHFVDRQILTETALKGQLPASRIALVGLGGVGKSQLAIEYAYRVRENSPNTWVFWIHGGSLTRFIEGFRNIAKEAKLPGRCQPDVDVLTLVQDWLSNEANGCWLMIIDNADDMSVFLSQENKQQRGESISGDGKLATPLDRIPQSRNGSLLITSRSREAAFILTGNYADIIKVNPMNQAQALTLLENKLGGGFEREDAVALVETLDCMPLAISQAAAYISQRAPRATVKRYLDVMRTGDREWMRLLDLKIHDSRRDGTASNSIIATWHISFEYIRKMRPSATQLLSLMSFFDRQGIPESLIHNYYEHNDDSSLDFEEDINTLMSFSLVTTDVGGSQFDMHRLVQFSTKKWLELNQELEPWKKKYVKLMDSSYPEGQYKNWPICQTLFPHAQAALSYRPNDTKMLQVWASVLFKAGCYATEMGNYSIAHTMSQGALEARENALGLDHPDTIRSLAKFGLVLTKQGRHRQAEAIFRQALEGRKKILGLDHPDTLSSISGLGSVLKSLGNYKEAETLHRQALEGRKRVLGLEHPETLSSVTNLGLALKSQGKYEEAEVMYRRALEQNEQMQGLEHPDTLLCVKNLGCVLERGGKYKEAVAMHQRVLESSEKVLGSEHPDTITSASNLGWVLQSHGRGMEAEAMLRRALEASEKVLGSEHPDTLTVVSNLGWVLQSQSRCTEAELLHRRALEGSKKVLGSEHPDTLSSFAHLGLVLKSLCRYREAEATHWKALEGYQKTLGLEHPDALANISHLGSVLQSQDRYGEAEKMHRRALEGYEKVLGSHHTYTLLSIKNLRWVLQKQGKDEEVETMDRRVTQMSMAL